MIDINKIKIGTIIFQYNKDRDCCIKGFYMKILKINQNGDFWSDYGDYRFGVESDFSLYNLDDFREEDINKVREPRIIKWYERYKYWNFRVQQTIRKYKLIRCSKMP